MNPLPLLLAAGAAVVLLGRKGSNGAALKPCDPLKPSGGTVEGINYTEVVTGGADPNSDLPMVIMLHGLGSKGANFAQYAVKVDEPARFILPDGILKWGSGRAWTNLRSRTEDQAALADELEYAASALAPFIRQISHCRPTRGKPIVSGHSQGGHMAYAISTLYPELIATAIPVSGWLPVELWSARMAPTYAMHGVSDRTVNFARTEDYAARMKAQGAPIHFTPVPGEAHGFSGNLRQLWIDTVEWANP